MSGILHLCWKSLPFSFVQIVAKKMLDNVSSSVKTSGDHNFPFEKDSTVRVNAGINFAQEFPLPAFDVERVDVAKNLFRVLAADLDQLILRHSCQSVFPPCRRPLSGDF